MTDELGVATDRLNEAFEQLEGALTALNLGVPASVKLDPEEDSQDRLLFGKTASGWKLLIERDNPFERIDLLKTSRETRLRAAKKLDELLLALGNENERQLGEVLGAIADVEFMTRKILARVKTGTSPRS